jgi:hypothetical protein
LKFQRNEHGWYFRDVRFNLIQHLNCALGA